MKEVGTKTKTWKARRKKEEKEKEKGREKEKEEENENEKEKEKVREQEKEKKREREKGSRTKIRREKRRVRGRRRGLEEGQDRTYIKYYIIRAEGPRHGKLQTEGKKVPVDFLVTIPPSVHKEVESRLSKVGSITKSVDKAQLAHHGDQGGACRMPVTTRPNRKVRRSRLADCAADRQQ